MATTASADAVATMGSTVSRAEAGVGGGRASGDRPGVGLLVAVALGVADDVDEGRLGALDGLDGLDGLGVGVGLGSVTTVNR